MNQTKFSEGAICLHPVVSFGSTIIGTALAEVLVAILCAPVAAILISIEKRLRGGRPGEFRRLAERGASGG